LPVFSAPHLHEPTVALEVLRLDGAQVAPSQAGREPEPDHEPVRLSHLEHGLDLVIVQCLGCGLGDARQNPPRER